ncbi:putative uncharacterized protein [Firmicutes bacterium CAG:460]|nr:putative uncharacterized protein [Firmicutes bacterium CAG:460]
MQIEVIIVAVIVFGIMTITGQISMNQLISDNQLLFLKIKEKDWDFLVRAKYGNNVNPDILFNKRIKNALITMAIAFAIMIKDLNAVKVLLIFVLGIFVFKSSYNDIKKYYQRHMAQIDSMLPHYLKNLEILIQHYTVPVAIGKSMAEAPEIFKDGLQEMIDSINAGDDSIEPYMAFARKYPVRDSMRMMRLLYRLSLGRQERKQEQILTFSRSISSLQQKARETRYKNRLEKMEGKTMSMLITTGVGLMVLLILAVIQLMPT